MNNRENPILYIVIPCYNEQEVLPITAPLFLKKLQDLTAAGKISRPTRTTSASARAATAATRTLFWPG